MMFVRRICSIVLDEATDMHVHLLGVYIHAALVYMRPYHHTTTSGGTSTDAHFWKVGS